MYCLVLKSSDEVIDRTSANNLTEARLFFMSRKQMNEETFNLLYDVKHSSE